MPTTTTFIYSNYPFYGTLFAYLCVGLVFVKLIYNRYLANRSLHRIPGPLLASVTDFWAIWLSLRRTQTDTYVALSDKYNSDAVRIGPSRVITKNLLATRGILEQENDGLVEIPNVSFPCVGAAFRLARGPLGRITVANLRRRSRQAINLVPFEPLIDELTREFLRFCSGGGGGECYLGSLLQLYAYDVVFNATFSRTLGLMMRHTPGPNVNAPPIDFAVGRESLFPSQHLSSLFPRMASVTSKVPAKLEDFLGDIKDSRSRAGSRSKDRQRDLLSYLLETSNPSDDGTKASSSSEYKSAATNFALLQAVLAARSTAMALQGLFEILLDPPNARMLENLIAEVDNTVALRNLAAEESSDPDIVSGDTARHMPYLDALVSEALRHFSPASPVTEFIVGSSSGFLLRSSGAADGYYHLQCGTVISCNTMAILRDRSLFGANPGVFRPERWLEADAARRQEMEGWLLAAALHGDRLMGGVVGEVLMKFVPAVVRKYKLKIVESNPSGLLERAAMYLSSKRRALEVTIEARNRRH